MTITPKMRTVAICLAARIVGRDSAEDAVQNACLKMLTTKSTWRGDAAFSTYFFQVVRNAAFEILRKSHATTRDARQTRPLGDARAHPLPGRSADERLIAQEERIRLYRALKAMESEANRRALLQAYFIHTDEQNAVAASALGISRNAFKSRLHWGRKQLAEKLEQQP